MWIMFFAIVIASSWIYTGASPFLWLARAMLLLEAIRVQLWMSAAVAWRYFNQEFKNTLEAVRAAELKE